MTLTMKIPSFSHDTLMYYDASPYQVVVFKRFNGSEDI